METKINILKFVATLVPFILLAFGALCLYFMIIKKGGVKIYFLVGIVFFLIMFNLRFYSQRYFHYARETYLENDYKKTCKYLKIALYLNNNNLSAILLCKKLNKSTKCDCLN